MSVSGIYQYFFLGEFYTKSWEIGPWFFQHTLLILTTLLISTFSRRLEKSVPMASFTPLSLPNHQSLTNTFNKSQNTNWGTETWENILEILPASFSIPTTIFTYRHTQKHHSRAHSFPYLEGNINTDHSAHTLSHSRRNNIHLQDTVSLIRRMWHQSNHYSHTSTHSGRINHI